MLIPFASDFVVQLRASLSTVSDAQSIELLKADVIHHISTLASSVAKSEPGSVSSATARNLEKQGRDLWNLCIRLKRSESYPPDARHLLARARQFAYCVIEAGRGKGKGRRHGTSNALYMLGLALVAARACMEVDDLDTLRVMLERAAALVSVFEGQAMEGEKAKLTVVYFSMRLALVSVTFQQQRS